MKSPPVPENENKRITALRDYEILDTDPEPRFDDLANLAATICETPIALVSLVDEDRQWFKSNIGLEAKETSREVSFCAHAINDPTQLFEIEDSRKDELFHDNPLVIDEPKVIFYAGYPLVDREGNALGTLCVIDHEPKKLDENQKEALCILGRQVISQIELRKVVKARDEQNKFLQRQMESRLEAESRLVKLNKLHEETERLAKIGSWRLDLSTNELHWSDEVYRIHQLKPGYPMALKEAIDFYHPDYLPIIRKAVDDGIKYGKKWDLELKLVTSKNQEKWVRAIGHPIRQNGRIVAISGLFHDIDTTRTLFLQLQERTQNLTAIIENTKDLIWSVDSEYKLIAFNDAFAKSMKGSLGRLIKAGDLVLDPVFPVEVLDAWKGHYDRVLAGESFATEVSYEQDGNVVNNMVSFNTIVSDDNRIVGCNAFMRDITREKTIQKELEAGALALKKSHEELQNLNEELELKVKERTEKLQRQADELGQFAHVASHDLQEPLRTITNYLQLLDEDYSEKLDDEARKYIERSVRATKRMKNLITDLLTYSRITSKKEIFEDVNLEKVLKSVLETMEIAIEETNASVKYDHLPTVKANFRQMSQLFQNLISNSIKYRKPEESPQIQVEMKKNNNHYHFSLTDNGIGISEEYLEKIFAIFQRLHTREEYPGTGIGLAICKRVLDQHKGKIWVESTHGAGSTFHFTLPLNKG